nr:antibiotic biosynthesis monooxygenase [uncultured Noviherbaspirillum sp.]
MAIWNDKCWKRPEIQYLSLSNLIHQLFVLAISVWLLFDFNSAHAREPQMIVRISEIQIHVEHLAQYKAILEEEAEASVRLEPGVIAIFPMYQRENDTEFRILEMYADRHAYEAHLKTPHFQKYKSTTLHMVKSLKLVDMHALDAVTMSRMFKKMKSR